MAINNTLLSPKLKTATQTTTPSFAGGSKVDLTSPLKKLIGSASPVAPTPSNNNATTSIPSPYVPSVVQSQPIPQQQPVKGLFPSVSSSIPSYSGIVANLNNAATPNAVQTGLVKNLSDTATGNKEIGDNAAKIAADYGARIAQVGNLGAGAVAGDLSTGTNIVGSGNAAIASQSASQRISALSAAEDAALQGTGQQLTGQAQQASAQNAALGGANTEQGQTLSGLSSAAGFAQPQTADYGKTVFNPLTGQYENGGSNLDPQTQAGSFAQKVMSGQMTYDQAVSSMGYAGNAGKTFLDNAITGAGGNPLQLQASGATTQNVISTQGQQIAQYQSALQQGKNLQTQLSDLITTFGLNPADLNAANAGLQKIAQNISSPQYKILQNYVNDIANTYAQVLTPPGGAQTDTSRSIASSMLDATAKGTSILTVMQSLDQAAHAKIAGVSTVGQNNSSGGSLYSF